MNYSNETLIHPFTQPLRNPYRWFMASLMLTVIALGWRYPILGYMVPLAMIAGIGGAFTHGRYVCGNLCPRGSFFDTLFRFFGGPRPIPETLRKGSLRWLLLALLMGLMAWQISLNPSDPAHWGRVFWLVCTLTTGVGILLGLLFRARTWCAICPVGTMAAAIGGGRYRLHISSSCETCGTCEPSCPMGFSIAAHRAEGSLPHHDCLKCSACASACPKEALSWPD